MINSRKWTNEQRCFAWIVISYARRDLKLTISPCIASAFVILHKYFEDPNHKDEPLYILITSALFLSCKIEDMYISMKMIFSSISKCIMQVCAVSKKNSTERVKELFGDRDFSVEELTPEEMRRVAFCEVHLLNAINWNMNIDIPFKYFNDAKIAFTSFSSNENTEKCFNMVLRDICLIMKDEKYLQIPPPVSAAASIEHAFAGNPLPPETSQWIGNLKQKFPNDFQLAMNIIVSEGAKCVPISKS